jgi:histidyl-tRNA synthetase
LEFTSIKGFKDILPDEVGHWQRLESIARRLLESYGYQEIRTPIMEWTELFARGIGLETDIVSKEMYSLEDSKGRGMTLRPEATASVVRAYIQQRLYQSRPVQKLYTVGPMFRHERPQKGRFRQFHQIDAEIIGDPGPRSDSEVIVMAVTLFELIGLDDLSLRLNSLGCKKCRPPFRDALAKYLKSQAESLCTDCRRRAESNPLRVFDCKVEACDEAVSGAPSILEYICADCQEAFGAVRADLDRAHIEFVLDPRLMRGLDYYARTTFEIQTERLGAQNALAGGGRYDGLVKLLGGPDHPAIGFAVGVERVVALLEEAGKGGTRQPDLYMAALGPDAQDRCFQWANTLRRAGLWVEMDYTPKGLKAQMKRADRLGAKRVLIVGDDEVASGKAVLRDMETKAQQEVGLDNLMENLKELLSAYG